MPVSPTYPGVYIDEIPSGNFTITGVQTSITAFVGRAAMGPTNDPTPCFNFGEFQNRFGGRSQNYPLSYAVEDFFLNGGSEAIIVRVEAAAASSAPAAVELPATASAAPAASGAPPSALLKLQAANNGDWGNRISATIDNTGITEDVAKRYGSSAANSFNLTLTYTKPDKSVVSERYTAVNLDDTPYRIDRVLQMQSNLAVVANLPPWTGPDATKPVTLPFAAGSDGPLLTPQDIIGDQGSRTGLYALEHTDLFNLLCIPWDQRGTDIDPTVNGEAAEYCASRRAMYIVDGPVLWTNSAKKGQLPPVDPGKDLGITDEPGQRNSAVYFPKIKKPDLERGGMIDVFPACGIIAGQFARTDATRGVWKAPAGIATGLAGVADLEYNLTDPENGLLNPIGINCLRSFRVLGPLIWGARTLRGADLMSDDYKYVPVRRLTLYIEESLYRGTQFAVFEPNDETLWSQLRLSVGAFMADLARQGAFYAYAINCDKTTTTQSDIDRGICNVRVAFAPVKPAEFIILQIQQQAGQIAA
jgi:phage tail sheath protein FI